MEEPVDINIGANKITGRNTGRELAIGSFVRARIVSLSPDTSDPRRSKIGLTSKQEGLGSPSWSNGNDGGE
jgi:DNA-directed RNA polymerase subunit E'/Rpb7